MRERDVRNAVALALAESEAFDDNGVWLFAPEDRGEGTSVARSVWIEPQSTAMRDEWDAQSDGATLMTCTLKMTFCYRDEDAQKRDEGAEQLFDVAANLFNGKILLEGFTLPALTSFKSWNWLPPTPPERQIVAIFSYQYLIEAWDEFDETE